jgi:hypothetical protein
MPEIYDVILETETDPDQPLKSSLAKRWSKNFIAALQGANNAPINEAAWHPYNKVTVGDSNTGLLYDFAVTGSVTEVITPDFVDGYEYRVRWESISNNTSFASTIQLWLETDGAYGGAISIGTLTTSQAQSGAVELPLVRRAVIAQPVLGWLVIESTSGVGGHTPLSSSCFRSPAQKRTRARLSWSTTDQGKVFLDKRTANY